MAADGLHLVDGAFDTGFGGGAIVAQYHADQRGLQQTHALQFVEHPAELFVLID